VKEKREAKKIKSTRRENMTKGSINKTKLLSSSSLFFFLLVFYAVVNINLLRGSKD